MQPCGTIRTCGQALIELLEAYRVDTVFGIPGVHTLELYRGLAGTGIRHVQARHEQGAGFMADGYARASGRPGVCLLISGPGVTNALTAMGQAYADSIPMLVISSDTPSISQGKGHGYLHEVTDLISVTRPVTAFSVRAHQPLELPELVARAFSVFHHERPRPVHISVPIDVLAQPVDETWRVVTPAARSGPADACTTRAARLLEAASTPIIVAGGGAIDAADEVVRLATRLEAPVVTSIRAKGVIPDSHPLSLGGGISHPLVHELLARADVVVAIGTELSETDSFVERLEIHGRLIRIDIDSRKINDTHPAAVGIVSDARPAVHRLLDTMSGSHPRRESAASRVKEIKKEIRRTLSAQERRHGVFLDTLHQALGPDTVIFGDMCQVVYTGAFLFPVEQPRHWHYPAGYCTLGCALPNAIGARLVLEDTPVVAICGDGGFMFSCQEIMTAVELELPLPIIVWNNNGYQQIRDDMRARGQALIGVDGRTPDFLALAQACGARARHVDSSDSLASALSDCLDGGRPMLIEVREDDDWLQATP